MIARLLLRLTAGLPARAIPRRGRPYIERHHVLRVGPLTVYLHRYLGSDGDHEVHDHPWRWALGIPLTGGYLEERVVWLCPRTGWQSRYRRIRPWRWNLIGARRFHRVARVLPETWTLFLTWRRCKSWGFLHCGLRAVVYEQPYDVAATHGWAAHAPPARELRRRSARP